MLFALAGNQNSGKTTLFNQLTGSNQHVGNFPGITVEKKEGQIRRHPDFTVVDLPGIYSLSPYSPEEIVSRNFIVQERPDVIINIVDATNIERNLYLSLQLIELRRPLVIALNMMDEVRTNKGDIDVAAMEKDLGVPVVPISASRNEGVDELLRVATDLARQQTLPLRLDFCSGPIHKAIHAVAHLVEDKAGQHGYSARFAASKLIEGDPLLERLLDLPDSERQILDLLVAEMETDTGLDREAALSDMRYQYIEKLVAHTVKKPDESLAHTRSNKIDRILAHRLLAIPIFLMLMFFIFWLTFGAFGALFSDLLESGIAAVSEACGVLLARLAVSDWLRSLILDGVLAGVGSVLTFLPIIVLLFFFLSILEDTGYMARVAFVMDKLLRKIGLSGRSCVPMIMGFGCSVPAVMATRTIPDERDRKITILLTPFMSCSAKLPIYAVFTAAFFPRHQALVMISLYVLGIAVAVLSGLLLKKATHKGSAIPFIMELPPYRFPSLKNVMINLWDKARGFIQRAFSIILLATIIIWFLRYYSWTFHPVADSADSMLVALGSLIAPIFAPLGFGSWQAATAVLAGLSAKETVVSTFAVLLTGGTASALQNIFTPLAAFSFLTFTLLYTPCIATLATMRREFGTLRETLLAVAYQTGTAWIVACLVYQVGRLLT